MRAKIIRCCMGKKWTTMVTTIPNTNIFALRWCAVYISHILANPLLNWFRPPARMRQDKFDKPHFFLATSDCYWNGLVDSSIDWFVQVFACFLSFFLCCFVRYLVRTVRCNAMQHNALWVRRWISVANPANRIESILMQNIKTIVCCVPVWSVLIMDTWVWLHACKKVYNWQRTLDPHCQPVLVILVCRNALSGLRLASSRQ